MDYIQKKIYKLIEKTKKRISGNASTIVGYYNVLTQYQLYLMFACIWDKREPELSQNKRNECLKKMKKATLGTILKVIVDLDAQGESILGIGEEFNTLMSEYLCFRNNEVAHGILVPGIQEEEYRVIADEFERIHKKIAELKIPILSHDCEMYYLPKGDDYQATVFDCDDYDYKDLNENTVKILDLQPGELHYLIDGSCYKISPFVILLETPGREDPYEIYCYQKYDLRNCMFEYKKYSELGENISYSRICKDYFLSFEQEFPHTIRKANGVICNKFENNYDYFISTSPIDTYEKKVWDFIDYSKSNACLTIRGGGGIGKTALVQYICNKNFFEPFDIGKIQFVIFCSAKDREFTQMTGLTGHIREIKNESIVRCYKDIIRIISWVICGDIEINDENDIKIVENKLLETKGVLLIIDDFETLSQKDKNKVVRLSSKLNVSDHKMIITTRSQYMVGEEYYIQGLDEFQTIAFMKERFKKCCTESQCKEFEAFTLDKANTEEIYRLTKGLPLLAIQLVNVLVISGINKSSLVKRNDEEIEDFLLGRLYSYFGTKTSKILFLIIAYYFQFGKEEILKSDLQIMYSLLCEKLKVINVDFEQDLVEIKKLNIVFVETDYIRISNYISTSLIRKCQDELINDRQIDPIVFDSLLFKMVIESGMRDGIMSYSEIKKESIDYAFVRLFVSENCLNLTNEQRFSILEKYILTFLEDTEKIRDVYRDCCQYFDIQIIEYQFAVWSKKYGFIIPELPDIHVPDQDTSIEYYLKEVINELNDQIESIDVFLVRRKQGASQNFCMEKLQTIRGKLGSICNIKLKEILSKDLKGCSKSLMEIKDLIEEISYTQEFSLLDNDQYSRLEKVIKDIQ